MKDQEHQPSKSRQHYSIDDDRVQKAFIGKKEEKDWAAVSIYVLAVIAVIVILFVAP